MKRIFLVLPLMVISLTACMSRLATDVPVTGEPSLAIPPTTIPLITESASPAPTEAPSNPKLPAAPFDAQTYVNETAGFALDYPSAWTVKEAVIGERGSQVQFLSAPAIADLATLPEGASRLTATIYQWDPQNDLAAYSAHMKSAWEASGFTVLHEEQLTLELGLPALQFTVQTPESTAVFLAAALGDQYLVVSGEGNLDLVKQIAQRLRPVSR